MLRRALRPCVPPLICCAALHSSPAPRAGALPLTSHSRAFLTTTNGGDLPSARPTARSSLGGASSQAKAWPRTVRQGPGVSSSLSFSRRLVSSAAPAPTASAVHRARVSAAAVFDAPRRSAPAAVVMAKRPREGKARETAAEGDGGDSAVATATARLPKEQLHKMVGARLAIPEESAAYVIEQTRQGATVPFLARYRQDETGHLTEDHIRAVLSTAEEVTEVHRRRQFMLTSLEQRGLLTHDIRTTLLKMVHVSQLEDFWEPFKVRKTSLAARARDAGLGPFAETILTSTEALPGNAEATIKRVEDGERLLVALIAEEMQRYEPGRQALLAELQQRGFFATSLVKSARKKSAKELDEEDFEQLKKKFQFYDQKRYAVSHLQSHVVLALMRGEAKGVLRLDFQCGSGSGPTRLFHGLVEQQFPGIAARKTAGRQHADRKGSQGTATSSGYKSPYGGFEMALVNAAIKLAYDHLYKSATNTIRRDLRKSAEHEAIAVFAHNLRHMLLQRPLSHARVLAMDPGLANGVKCVALDEAGDVVTFFKCSLLDEAKMMDYVAKVVETKKLNKIVIGNGTASQRTAHLVARTIKRQKWQDVEFAVVSEAGASVYSVSDTAKEEFPSLDIMYRGAVSIGRRVMDPLSELVKIPVRSMGIGMYQHDVNEKELLTELGHVVESCVAAVGVNSASTNRYVMEKVPGIQKRLVDQIVLARHARRLNSREDLRKVAGMTEATYNQVVGFFRFPNSPEPLDNTNIHPESYSLVKKVMTLFESGELGAGDIVGGKQDAKGHPDGAVQRRQAGLALTSLSPDQFAAMARQLHCGVETLRLVATEFLHPALDPRASLPHAGLLRKEIKEPKDLKPGELLDGIVQSVTTFGAFVDCGFHNNVLVRTDVDRVQVGMLLRGLVFQSLDHLGRVQVKYTLPPLPTAGKAGGTADRKGLRLEADDSMTFPGTEAEGEGGVATTSLSAHLARARDAAAAASATDGERERKKARVEATNSVPPENTSSASPAASMAAPKQQQQQQQREQYPTVHETPAEEKPKENPEVINITSSSASAADTQDDSDVSSLETATTSSSTDSSNITSDDEAEGSDATSATGSATSSASSVRKPTRAKKNKAGLHKKLKKQSKNTKKAAKVRTPKRDKATEGKQPSEEAVTIVEEIEL